MKFFRSKFSRRALVQNAGIVAGAGLFVIWRERQLGALVAPNAALEP